MHEETQFPHTADQSETVSMRAPRHSTDGPRVDRRGKVRVEEDKKNWREEKKEAKKEAEYSSSLSVENSSIRYPARDRVAIVLADSNRSPTSINSREKLVEKLDGY